jgi:hypothetical protein
VRRTAIEPVDWEPWAGGRLATPMRLALDLLLGRALPDAVADLDAELADPRAEWLPESKLRVYLVLDGLAPVPQYWIQDGGGRIARADLALPEYKIAIRVRRRLARRPDVGAEP